MEINKIYENGLQYHHYANTAYPLTPSSFMEYKIRDEAEIYDFVKSEWDKIDQLSLYIHIPFCKLRCKFCEYTVLENPAEEVENEYVDLLLKEMAIYKDIVKGKKIVGYDLGGGTPTKLSAENLSKITKAVKESFLVEKDVVFSIETTPVIAAKEPEKIAAVYDMGYKRISMGIQTVSEKLLNELGREGATQIYEEAVKNIRKAGFSKFNIDIMYGFLHQNDDELENTLRYGIALNPEYITLYRNRYKGTKIESEAGGVSLYKVMKQYRLAYKILTENGYEANVGKNTFSRVQGDYGTSDYLTKRVIEGRSYIGMGLGAQSFGEDYLAYNSGAANKKMEEYKAKILSGKLPIQDIYRLPKAESIGKMVSVAFYFGFVDLPAFEKRFGISFLEEFKEEVKFVIDNELMEIQGDRLILTSRGSDCINGIIPLFYSKRSQVELEELFKKKQDTKRDEEAFLSAYSQSDYERPSVAVDMVVFTIKNKIIEDYRKLAHKEFSLLLIKRGEHPYMNEWALPGGFVRGGESVEETAYRELVEETGVKEISLTQLHCFSEPKRDPRGWIISNAFIALAEEEQFNLRSGDDAIDARWFCVNYELVKTERETQGNIRRVTEQYQLQLKHEEDNIVLSALIEVSTRICSKRRTVEYKILESEGIAFDHGKIIAYGINDLRERVKTTTIAFDLLPELFTLTDLQKAHELILNEKLLVANFRRKMTEFVIETDNMVEGQGHRPSKLFMQKL